jgi:6,7-dimethyl-8-ribityllumazine synthase
MVNIKLEKRIAIICSVFNSEITEKLLDGAYTRLIGSGINKSQIEVFKVPGAIEVPLTAKLLAQTNKYHAIISLGCVIRGETSHYDYVCEQVSHGCQEVMLQFNVPVIFGVLTTNNLRQAKARVSKKSHKGIEAADTAIAMINLIEKITAP